MKNLFTKPLIAAVLAVITFALMSPFPAAAAQLNSSTQSVTMNLTISESLSLAVTPSTVSFNCQGCGGNVTASAPIQVVTTWGVNSSRSSLNVCEYVANTPFPSAAGISPSMIYGAVDSGSATAFGGHGSSNCNSLGMAGPDLFDINSNLGTSQPTGTHTDTTTISLQGLPGSLANGTYSGTLNFVAVVN